jgi:hypothetical protein
MVDSCMPRELMPTTYHCVIKDSRKEGRTETWCGRESWLRVLVTTQIRPCRRHPCTTTRSSAAVAVERRSQSIPDQCWRADPKQRGLPWWSRRGEGVIPNRFTGLVIHGFHELIDPQASLGEVTFLVPDELYVAPIPIQACHVGARAVCSTECNGICSAFCCTTLYCVGMLLEYN